MLRTFCSNPTLGGFGSESTTSHFSNDAQTPDAFCQIIKELVDNAVDACNVSMIEQENFKRNLNHPVKKKKVSKAAKEMALGEKAPTKRVRVVIEPFTDRPIESSDSSTANSGKRELLRVTVTDNGCGMNDIEACVGAFHSSKAHNSTRQNNFQDSRKANDDFAANEAQTVGRYGIGLTLCLLHAQRLVPDSCASIQSAVPTDSEWKLVTAVVDTDLDRVQCFSRDGIPKSSPNESGTSISVLVPGGSSATIAWSRLAEYFARFKLSLGMTCSLEVLAPSLSRVPLWVQPSDKEIALPGEGCVFNDKNSTLENSAAKRCCQEASNVERFDFWGESLPLENEDVRYPNKSRSSSELSSCQSERIQIWNAVKSFLGQSVDLANVSHATVPIRIEKDISEKRDSTSKKAMVRGPQLTVDVIVHDAKSQGGDFLTDSTGEFWEDSGNFTTDNEVADMNTPASMVLIRMVNKIPLLDSAEGVACGLVQCLASKKRMWNSFGLDVHLNIDPENTNSVPTFDVRDSEQVIPFFKQGAHNLLEGSDDDCTEAAEDSDNDHDGDLHVAGSKRSKRTSPRNLLPASVRLGSILVIVQIHAEPSVLPLPTLSKGRLPIGNKAIDDAFEIGITQCLQQLQKTNSNLLLTASELRRAECDARYVPAVSLALASILSRSTLVESLQCIDSIQRWKGHPQSVPSNLVANWSGDETSCSSYHRDGPCHAMKRDDLQALGSIIERQLRSVLSNSSKSIGDADNNESDGKSSVAPLMKDVNSVPRKKEKKKSKGSKLVDEVVANKSSDHIEDGAYRDFDEWL